MTTDDDRQLVTRMLTRVDNITTPTNRRALSRELRRLQPEYSRALNSLIPDIVDEVSDFERGWDLLLQAIDNLNNLFPPTRKQVTQLRECLVKIRLNDKIVTSTLNRLREFGADGYPPGWQAAYYRTANPKSSVNSADKALEKILEQQSPHDACAFLERLAVLFPPPRRDLLQQTNETIAEELAVTRAGLLALRDQVAEEPVDEADELRMHLLVRLDGRIAKESVAAWLSWRPPINAQVPDGWQYGIRCHITNSIIEGKDDLRRVLAALIAELTREASVELKPPIIELMVEWDQFVEPFDQWTLPDGTKLGEIAPVVIRPLPKAKDECREQRDRRWSAVPTSGMNQVYPVGPEWSDPEPTQDWVGLIVGHGDEVMSLVASAHHRGYPLVLWCRQQGNGGHDGGDMRGLLNGQRLVSLPDLVFRSRKQNRNSHFVLMWDDPRWILDGGTLRWRSA